MQTIKGIIVFLLGAASVVYLVNPGAGIFELIPDNIPGIGNLDEAGATAVLLAALAYFGYDLGHIFGKKKEPPASSTTMDVNAEVISQTKS